MKKQEGYDFIEISDLKLGMVLEFRDIKEINNMHKKKLILAGWCEAMDRFVKQDHTVTITQEILDYFQRLPVPKFERGVISSSWTFSLSMFKIANTKEAAEEVKTTILEEERGTIMKLGEIFVSNEKETLQEAIAAIQPSKCLDNLKTYLLSGTSNKGAIEKCYVSALQKNLRDFLVLLHLNASKKSVEDLLAEILKNGFSGFAKKDIDYCIGDLNQYNSIDSHKLVVEFMTETLNEVLADIERTAKEKELVDLKLKQDRLVYEEKRMANELKELEKKIKELEA